MIIRTGKYWLENEVVEFLREQDHQIMKDGKVAQWKPKLNDSKRDLERMDR